MAYKATVKVKLSCPKHPRFNPARGRGAVVGACKHCDDLCDIYHVIGCVQNRLRDFSRLSTNEFKQEVIFD